MAKTVRIPETSSPFEVCINGRVYVYPPGVELSVPDEVAEMIEAVRKEMEPDYRKPVTDFIPNPSAAEVGQTIRVSAVDEDGRPTAWECVEMGAGGGCFVVTADVDPNFYQCFTDRTYEEVYEAVIVRHQPVLLLVRLGTDIIGASGAVSYDTTQYDNPTIIFTCSDGPGYVFCIHMDSTGEIRLV